MLDSGLIYTIVGAALGILGTLIGALFQVRVSKIEAGRDAAARFMSLSERLATQIVRSERRGDQLDLEISAGWDLELIERKSLVILKFGAHVSQAANRVT